MSIKVTSGNQNVRSISNIESNRTKTVFKNGMKIQAITPKTEISNKKWPYAAAATVASVIAIGLAVFAYYDYMNARENLEVDYAQPFCARGFSFQHQEESFVIPKTVNSSLLDSNATNFNASLSVLYSNATNSSAIPLPLDLNATNSSAIPLPLDLNATNSIANPLPLDLNATNFNAISSVLYSNVTNFNASPSVLYSNATNFNACPLPLDSNPENSIASSLPLDSNPANSIASSRLNLNDDTLKTPLFNNRGTIVKDEADMDKGNATNLIAYSSVSSLDFKHTVSKIQDLGHSIWRARNWVNEFFGDLSEHKLKYDMETVYRDEVETPDADDGKEFFEKDMMGYYLNTAEMSD